MSVRLRRPLGVILLIVYICRLLLGTLTGVLALALTLYLVTPQVTSVEPFSLAQLVLWFDDLGVEAKVGLATSMVTVLGFFIALKTAMYSWQKQTAASLRMSAAEAIDRVVTEVSAAVLRMQMFAKQVKKRGPKSVAQGSDLPIRVIPASLGEMSKQFVEDRKRLLVLHQEVLALPARYSIIFLPVPHLEQSLEAIGGHVGEVSKQMWHVTQMLPPPGLDAHSYGYVSEKGLGELIAASEVAHGEISGLLGALRGALFSPIVELNSAAVLKMSRALFGKFED